MTRWWVGAIEWIFGSLLSAVLIYLLGAAAHVVWNLLVAGWGVF